MFCLFINYLIFRMLLFTGSRRSPTSHMKKQDSFYDADLTRLHKEDNAVFILTRRYYNHANALPAGSIVKIIWSMKSKDGKSFRSLITYKIGATASNFGCSVLELRLKSLLQLQWPIVHIFRLMKWYFFHSCVLKLLILFYVFCSIQVFVFHTIQFLWKAVQFFHV